jgi:hypothetical protein
VWKKKNKKKMKKRKKMKNEAREGGHMATYNIM